MSQKTEIRLDQLEQDVRELRRLLQRLEGNIMELRADVPPEEGFKPVHRGHGRWAVIGSNGEPTSPGYMSKREARDHADSLNEALPYELEEGA